MRKQLRWWWNCYRYTRRPTLWRKKQFGLLQDLHPLIRLPFLYRTILAYCIFHMTSCSPNSHCGQLKYATLTYLALRMLIIICLSRTALLNPVSQVGEKSWVYQSGLKLVSLLPHYVISCFRSILFLGEILFFWESSQNHSLFSGFPGFLWS